MSEQPQTDTIIGVLLAGGRSSRMGGGDKCLLKLAGQPMLRRVADRLSPQVGRIVLNANGDPDRFLSYGLPVVPDPVEGFAGPLAGVLAGLRWTQENEPKARWIVTAATDTPFFPQDLVAHLRAAVGSTYPAIALARSRGQLHPVFGLWPAALANDLACNLTEGTRKVLDWTGQHPAFEADFADAVIGGDKVDPFMNVNTPDDLAHAEDLLAGGRVKAE